MIRVALACVLALLTTEVLADDHVNIDPVAADQELRRFADLIMDDVPPAVFKGISFKTKEDHTFESEATIVWKGSNDAKELIWGVVVAARIYAAAIATHHPITKAIVFFDAPKGKVHVSLKLKYCTALLKAELARPRDQDQREKALARFMYEHIGAISKPQN
jgi:hypothetical protein